MPFPRTLIWGILIALGTLHIADAANLIYINGSFNISTPIEKPEALFEYVDKNKDVTFYTFGFNGKENGPETMAMTNAFKARNNTNFILVDWEKEANGPLSIAAYPFVVANAIKVASDLGKAIVKFIENGIAKVINLIAHSLGAHLMGWAGGKVQELIQQNVSSIIGLDPAGAGFGQLEMQGLNPTQAQFVLGLHTNAGKYGINHSVGHVDFWANCAEGLKVQRQPGCPDGYYLPLSREDLCNHIRSVYLYIYSYTEAYPAAFAESCKDWKYTNSSNAPLINYFGRNVDPGKPGNFFVSTTSEPPYNKGLAGITCY